MSREVRVPDIGDFAEVGVVEILVSLGDTIGAEDPLVTLESDKASMDIPSPFAGTIVEITIAVGDIVSEGALLLLLDGDPSDGGAANEDRESDESGGATPDASPTATPDERPQPPTGGDHSAEVVVLGAGPGGYSAAFRAADLGLSTILVERAQTLGGVCLNVGCIPSKALLHAAKVISEASELSAAGIEFGVPTIDQDGLRAWKDSIVSTLTGGLAAMAKARGVTVIRGEGRFGDPNTIEVTGPDGAVTTVKFGSAIVAVGSAPAQIPGLPEDPRIIDSTGALELDEIPQRLLVIGGGIIGLEMATIYDALGSRVSIVELLDSLVTGCDPDIVRPLQKRIEGRYEAIMLETSVAEIVPTAAGLDVRFEGGSNPGTRSYDRILVAIGRRANGRLVGAEQAGVAVDERGLIAVDPQMRTNLPHIYAIGDVVGQPMLAHKATHQAHVAAEVIAGHAAAFNPATVPSVAYTDPELAWAGLTETAAKAAGIAVEKAVFPWAASGRSLSLGRSEGITKLLFDPASRRLLGAGIVGSNAGELIAEAAHGIEMGSDAADLALTIHPHPTLSETIGLAAEVAEGTITDLPPQRRR